MQKWITIYKNMKIKNKLSLLISLIVAMAFTFAVIVQQYAFSIYDEQLYLKSSQVLHLSSSAIESELERIEQLSFNIITDTQIQNMLHSIAGSDSDYDRLILRQHLADRLLNYVGSEPMLYSIHLIDSYDKQQDVGSVVPIHPTKKEFILQLAGEADGEERWVYPDEMDSALLLSREIRSYSGTLFDLNYLGTIIIRINMDKIVRKSTGGEGDLIVTSGTDVIYPATPHFDPAVIQSSLSSGNGYLTREMDGQTYFIAHNRSRNTGWTYMNVTPFNQSFKQIIFIKELVIIVFTVIFAVAILLGIRFSRGLTRPIESLITRMKLAEKGNFAEANVLPQDAAPVAMNELGLLHRTFRLMIERINALITENYSNQLLIKETEFKALQAQINPHFLYNTLESVNWLAKMNKQTQISDMVQALAFLLRNSVSLKEPILTLGEELEIVRNYVIIQKFRFEDRLDFTMDVKEQDLQRKIPKLSLQPLLENAIHYALEPSVNPCRITLSCKETPSAFCVIVEDDGPGMAPDTLTRLRSGEIATSGNGIGLLNIDERIKLAFGEHHGLAIDSGSGLGTQVMLSLPK
ncbi:sensor histidine kinase [Paenibacillus lautus]|uniref:cache domain-containing sensor histidine kinase n=1 Tax=Paenibacillus lautus TaxID=1401 RepID=UPI003D2BD34B